MFSRALRIDQVGEGLPGPVVGVDDHAQLVEVFLEGDRGILPASGGLLAVLFQQLDDSSLRKCSNLVRLTSNKYR